MPTVQVTCDVPEIANARKDLYVRVPDEAYLKKRYGLKNVDASSVGLIGNDPQFVNNNEEEAALAKAGKLAAVYMQGGATRVRIVGKKYVVDNDELVFVRQHHPRLFEIATDGVESGDAVLDEVTKERNEYAAAATQKAKEADNLARELDAVRGRVDIVNGDKALLEKELHSLREQLAEATRLAKEQLEAGGGKKNKNG